MFGTMILQADKSDNLSQVKFATAAEWYKLVGKTNDCNERAIAGTDAFSGGRKVVCSFTMYFYLRLL